VTMEPSAITATQASRWPALGLLTANAVSLLGSEFTSLAIPWFVLVTTGSAAKTGLVAFFRVVPAILAAFMGGALVDRVGNKRMSVLADLLSGLAVAAVPLLYHTVGLAFPTLLALVFLGTLLDVPGGTARTALFPDVAALSGIRLERMNSATQGVQSFASLLGPPLAGLAIVVLGTSNVLWLDAASFAFSAVLIARAVPRDPPRSAAAGGYRDEVLDGWRFLRGDRLLRSLLALAAITNLAISPLFPVVLPVLARERFGSAQDLGFIFAGFGAGALAASLAYGAIGHRLPRRLTYVGTCLALTLPLFALATVPSLLVCVAALAVMGVAIGIVNPATMTLFQERVPAELRGRVFGTTLATVLVATPLGMLLAGSLIQTLGLHTLLFAMGACLLATTVAAAINPALRELPAAEQGCQP